MGKRTIDLTLSSEAFRHELFSASADALGDLAFAGVISHRARLKLPERKQSLGTDAALAALQRNLASMQQEKQAQSANITNSLLPTPKNRFDAAKEQKRERRRGLIAPSSSQDSGVRSAAGLGPAVDLADESAARAKAMRTSLVHLLAMKPLSREQIQQTTRIPAADLDEALQRIGKETEGSWQLTPRAYKDLDVWKFAYRTQADRQAAIDNAIKAYDRLRLGKEDNTWQMLLPVEDRGKGIVLSKLQLGNGNMNNRNLTPNHAASPMAHDNGSLEEKSTSAANTPRLGPALTPKVGAAKGDSVSKRLLSKDPKKARAAAEASKEKKRKEPPTTTAIEKDASNSARKKQATKTNNPKIKSAELVDSSDDEMDDQIDLKPRALKPGNLPTKTPLQSKANGALRKVTPATSAKTTPKAQATSVTKNGDASALTARPRASLGSAAKGAGTTTTPSATSKASKPSQLGKSTPSGLAAPSGGASKPQYSPNRTGTKPSVPSPLGAARPRGVSDVSDRPIASSARYRSETETSRDSIGVPTKKYGDTANKADRTHLNAPARELAARKPLTNGTTTSKPLQSTTTNSTTTTNRPSTGQKRKPVDSPTESTHDLPAPKQRKVSSKPPLPTGAGGGGGASSSCSSSSNSADDAAYSFTNGLRMAERFRDVLYPQYTKLYDEQEAKERRGEKVSEAERKRLLQMHARLRQMKREIRKASEREGLEA